MKKRRLNSSSQPTQANILGNYGIPNRTGRKIFGVLAVASLGIQSEVGRYFKTLGEPPNADPLAWVVWWWGVGEDPHGYPIGQMGLSIIK